MFFQILIILFSGSIIFSLKASNSCLGPPFIYATFHQYGNIRKYSRNGCLLDSEVLQDTPSTQETSEFRSLIYGNFKSQEALYIADAQSKSQILTYGSCHNGKRKFIQSILNREHSQGLEHPYGICFDDDQNLLVSNQHSDCILRFQKDTFRPMPISLSLRQNYSHSKFFPGTFAQFNRYQEGVRSILFVNGRIWVAHENVGVILINIKTGVITDVIHIPSPVGLYYHPSSGQRTDPYSSTSTESTSSDSTFSPLIQGLVFVSSKQKHQQGAVYGVNATYLKIEKKYTVERMTHPTGVALYIPPTTTPTPTPTTTPSITNNNNDNNHRPILYVSEQVLGKIYSFDLESQEMLGIILSDAPGDMEQLLLSNC